MSDIVISTNENGSKQEIDNVVKKKEFDLFVLWSSIPPLMKHPPKQRDGTFPQPREFAVGMGIEDEELLDLISIQTLTQFGERFDLNKNTLTEWKRIIKQRGLHGLPSMKNWAMEMSSNLLMSLYNHAMKKGNPLTIKLWFQLVNDWKENTKVEHIFIPVKTIRHKDYDPVADGRARDSLGEDAKAEAGISLSH